MPNLVLTSEASDCFEPAPFSLSAQQLEQSSPVDHRACTDGNVGNSEDSAVSSRGVPEMDEVAHASGVEASDAGEVEKNLSRSVTEQPLHGSPERVWHGRPKIAVDVENRHAGHVPLMNSDHLPGSDAPATRMDAWSASDVLNTRTCALNSREESLWLRVCPDWQCGRRRIRRRFVSKGTHHIHIPLIASRPEFESKARSARLAGTEAYRYLKCQMQMPNAQSGSGHLGIWHQAFGIAGRHDSYGSTLGSGCRAGSQGGRHVLLLGPRRPASIAVRRAARACRNARTSDSIARRPTPSEPDSGRAGAASRISRRSNRQSARVAEICRLIESAPDTPSLASLSKRAGLSPYYFHRVFVGDRIDAEGACIGAPRETRSQRAQEKGQDSDRSHLRRRVQLGRPFL